MEDTQTLEGLNRRFGCARVHFEEGPGGLPVARLEHPEGAATVVLQGGHVQEYFRTGGRPVLWTSASSQFDSGRPIRGGVPVCWPWFAAHPDDPALPAHGFARLRAFTVRNVAVQEGAGVVQIAMGLRDDEQTRALWPHAFDLECRVTLGRRLSIALTARNTGDTPLTLTGALHSYFAVSDVREVRIEGLDGVRYLDKLAGGREGLQSGPITIGEEVDRIYLDTEGECVIEDPVWGRSIRVGKRGSRTTVVWNPWIAKAARMPDFGDDEYPEMLCVEAANAGPDVVHLAPGGEHLLMTTIEDI